MQGKTVLITGADGDIGKNTTKGIAQKGPETSSYLGCADKVKEISEQAYKELGAHNMPALKFLLLYQY